MNLPYNIITTQLQDEDQPLPGQSEVDKAFRLLSKKYHPDKVTIQPFRMMNRPLTHPSRT